VSIQKIPRPEPLFHHLFHPDRGYLVTASSNLSLDDDWKQRSWRYPERAERAAQHVIEQAQLERDTYFCVHLLREFGNRQATNSMPTVWALWLDEDTGRYPDEGPEPTAIIHSSAKRRHLYWRLTHPVAVEWATSLNKRIAQWSGGDEGKHGLASVLRPAGTANFKPEYERPQLVGGYFTGVEAWDPAVLDQAIPPMPEPEVPPRPRGAYTGPELDLGPYLQAVEVLGKVPDSHGLKYRVVCPWVHEHSHGDRSGTRLGQRSSGALWFHCDHEHCCSRGWQEFRNEVRPQLGSLTIINIHRGSRKASPAKTKEVRVRRG
jgi:hypothetical protein